MTCLFRRSFRRFFRRRHDVLKLIQIYGDTIMSQLDDLNTAIADLSGKADTLAQAVADLPSRLPSEPDLSGPVAQVQGAAAKVQAASDALNAINPAPPAPPAPPA